MWLQYLSHKVGRLVVPWALLAVLVSSVALASRHWGYTAALGAQLAFYGLAILGGILDWRERHARVRRSGEGPAVVAEEAMR